MMALLRFNALYSRAKFYETVVRLLNKTSFNPAKGLVESHDEINLYDFGQKFLPFAKRVACSLETKSFSYKPLLRKIKHLDGKVREIFVAPWQDRLVDLFLYEALDAALNKYFAKCVYGFRTNGQSIRGCVGLVRRLLRAYQGEEVFILRRDVSNFFPSIDKSILKEQIREAVDDEDYLYRLLLQRIDFSFVDSEHSQPTTIEKGLAFGTPIACCLSNIYLTNLDKQLQAIPDLTVFRYVDDILVVTRSQAAAEQAKIILADGFAKLRVFSKPTHEQDLVLNAKSDRTNFTSVKNFSFLGLEFSTTQVRLQSSKKQKIVRCFTAVIDKSLNRKKKRSPQERAAIAAHSCGKILNSNRVVAKRLLIDYYLSMVTDEQQLKDLDTQLKQYLLQAANGYKGFKAQNLSIMSSVQLHQNGMPSLLHRSRLLRHGELRTDYFQIKKSMLSD